MCRQQQEKEENSDIPNFVTSSSRHVPNPFYARVVALLENLEVPHQQPGAREHQQAEAQVEWGSTPCFLIRHARQLGLGAEDKLALPGEAANLPHNVVLRRLVLGFALGAALCDPGGVERCRDADNNVGGEELGTKVGADTDAILDLGLADLVDDRVYLEGQVDVLGGAVPHQLELAIRRNEADDAIAVKLPKLDALVELAVLQRHASRSGLGRLASHPISAGQTQQPIIIQQQAVVEAKLALRCPAQVCAHDDLARNIGAQHGACCAHQQVDVLDDIDEGFVLAVLDVGLAPRQGAGGLHGNLGRLFGRALRLDAFGRDVHLERVGLGVLGVAKVDDLCSNNTLAGVQRGV